MIFSKKGIMMGGIIVLMSVATLGCSVNVAKDIAYELGISDRLTESDTVIKEGLDDMTLIETDLGMGSITLSYHDEDTAEVKYEYEVTGNKEEKLEDILKEIEMVTVYKDGALDIRFVKKGTDRNLWNWLSDNYMNYNINVDLDIAVPKGTNTCNLSTNMGDITIDSFVGIVQAETSMGDIVLNQVEGTIDGETSMGDIEANDIIFVEDCNLSTNMGNIECSIADAKVEADVKLTSNMGNVEINAKKITISKLKEAKDMMSDSLFFVANDVCEVDASTDMGKTKLFD